ncbi:MAG: peptide chain release factor-like protein [Fibrobacteria bacterium]
MSRSPAAAGEPGSGGSLRVTVASAYRWLSLDSETLLSACGQARFQGSGPGGQKRNRVYSGVRLTHPESGLSAESVDSRASLRNLHAALARLRLHIALAADLADAEPAGDPGGPARAGQPAFRADANPAHADFPGFALRALHQLARQRGQLAGAAAVLGCTASALTRFYKSDKAVWAKARSIRETNGLHALK